MEIHLHNVCRRLQSLWNKIRKIRAIHRHAETLPNVDRLVIVQPVRAYQIILDHHQIVGPNVLSILIAHQISHVSLNVVEIHATDLVVSIQVQTHTFLYSLAYIIWEREETEF